MQLCWSSSESRPSIFQIDVMLCDLLEVCKNTSNNSECPSVSADDFDRRWEMLKPNTIVKTDNHTTETDDDLDVSNFIQDKQMSPSLNNLLDDGTSVHMESWLENVALKTNDGDFNEEMPDMEKAIDDHEDDDARELQKNSLSDVKFKHGLKVEFKLCPMSQRVARSAEILNDRTSSESETEDENWKRKIERGAYSEKVRQKSRSVTDLMVLTHIDCSESDSETPLPSLDYKANFYKNVRYGPRQNLENVSLMFGSEGNLLSIQNTFQEELQKLKEERKDSLLFVPESTDQEITGMASRKILEELNSTTEIKPVNQVFNVFNVTVSPKYNFNDVPRLKQALSMDKINADFSPEIINQEKSERNFTKSANDLSDIDNNLLKKELQNDFVDKTLDLLHQPAESKLEINAPDLLADLINKQSSLSEGAVQAVLPEICSDTSDCYHSPAGANNQPQNFEDPDSIIQIFKKELINATKEFIDGEIRLYDHGCDFVNKCDNSEPVNETADDSGVALEINKDEESFQTAESAEVKLEEFKEDNIFSENLASAEDLETTSKDEEDSHKHENTEKVLKEFKDTDSQNVKGSDDLTDNIDMKDHLSVEELKIASNNFLENERLHSDGISKSSFEIKFDLSENQQSIQPNSLTHSMVFTSSPFVKKQLENSLRGNDYTSLTLFDGEPDQPDEVDPCPENNLTYSIETWDNFLEKTLESQEECFSSFNSEPQSILFIENDADLNHSNDLNNTYIIEEPTENDCNNKETKTEDHDKEKVEDSSNQNDNKNWEAGEGWFLHPQSNEDVSGQMEVQETGNSTSYVGFSMDDEIMAAIRNELLQKLPHAQVVLCYFKDLFKMIVSFIGIV